MQIKKSNQIQKFFTVHRFRGYIGYLSNFECDKIIPIETLSEFFIDLNLKSAKHVNFWHFEVLVLSV